jgi:geranylgeranyl reductase family protein
VQDLAVVGAGPAGLLAAARCAQAGLTVTVLEEHERIGEPTHCTGIISVETARLAGTSDEILLTSLDRARFHGPGATLCEMEWDGPAGERIHAIDRAAFDRELAAKALRAGVALETGARVERIAVDRDGVELQVGSRRVRARACVLAAGVSYRFQRQLGLGLPAEVAHTAQIEVDVAAAEPHTVELHVGREVAPGGFLWAVPTGTNGHQRLKIGALVRGDAAASLRRFLERPAMRARLLAPPPAPRLRLLPLKPIARTWCDRVLAVGDAGGFTKPTTGGGIFFSLVTASLAAETFIEGFRRGRLDGAFLSGYERRWRAKLGSELRIAAWLRSLLTVLTDSDVEALIRVVSTRDVQGVIRTTAHFNWHRDVILALLRERSVARLLFRSVTA